MNTSQKELHCKVLKEIQQELINDNHGIYYVNNSEDSINKKDGGFIWIGAQGGYIGHKYCHYECIFHNNTINTLSVEVHFSEKEINSKFDDTIKGKKQFSIKDDWTHDNGNRRIVFNKKITFSKTDIQGTVKNAIKLLKQLDTKLGKELAQIEKEQYGNKIIKQNKLLSPTDGKPSSGIRKRPETINFKSKIYKCAHEKVEEETINALKKKYNNKTNTILIERKLNNIKPDILVHYDNQYDVYEVKPYKNPIDCIDEALGQLLVYSYILSSNIPKYNVNQLFIVGPTKTNQQTNDFMNHIKKKYNLKNISYVSPKEI